MENNLFKLLKEDNLSVTMPNELFKELLEMESNDGLKAVHLGYTYSFIYLQTYLYRYAKYGQYIPSKKEIKELLGYSPLDKRTDYITKKDGLLEQKNILTTDNDFPIIADMGEDDFGNRVPMFTCIREYCYELKYEEYNFLLKRLNGTKASKYKYPVFAFERFEDEDGYCEEGTFYNNTNTTILDIRTFLFCMSTEGIGVNGFYLYAYLNHQNFKFKGDFNATLKRIGKEIGLSYGTVYELMKHMREHNLITTMHNMEYVSFAVAQSERKPSTHKVNSVEDFSKDKIEYEKLPFVSNKEHIKRSEEKFKHGKIHIELSELPF